MSLQRTQATGGSVPVPMSTLETTILGALGGVTVSIATYPAGSGYGDLFLNLNLGEWIGFLLRVFGGGLVGGLWGYLHRPEHDRRRAFQLGLVAPAAIASLVYANSGDKITKAEVTSPPATTQSGSGSSLPQFSLVGKAHAGELSDLVVILTPKSGPGDFTKRVLQGFVGK